MGLRGRGPFPYHAASQVTTREAGCSGHHGWQVRLRTASAGALLRRRGPEGREGEGEMQSEETRSATFPSPEAWPAVIPSWSMSAHHEERRALSLLRQTLVQSGVPIDIVESRLGWEPGRLVTSL